MEASCDSMRGQEWFIPSPRNEYPAIIPPTDITLELDYDSLTKNDIEWISKYCPHILETIPCSPPPFQEGYYSTLKKYNKVPKIMKKIKRR
jgi:hypothetical protein